MITITVPAEAVLALSAEQVAALEDYFKAKY